jgi:Glyoxalase/Bleomycin resistance protein/Dioxygenase superfamily
MQPKTLDHVAFWIADREPLVDFATRYLGMHVIDHQDAFTLIGSDARHGKLTLFGADGPRERGALKHVALRVSDLESARAELPDGSADDVELGESRSSRRRRTSSTTSITSRSTRTTRMVSRASTRGWASQPLTRATKVIRGSRLAALMSSSIPGTRESPSGRC